MPTTPIATMSTPTDLSSDFADFVVNTKYTDLPADAIDGAKKSILDTLAVMIAATGVEPAVRGVADLVRDMGGKPESSILGFGAGAGQALGHGSTEFARAADDDGHFAFEAKIGFQVFFGFHG